MPKPEQKIANLDQAKAGLQDDHDPREPAQKQNDKPKGVKSDASPEGETQGGVGSQGGM